MFLVINENMGLCLCILGWDLDTQHNRVTVDDVFEILKVDVDSLLMGALVVYIDDYLYYCIESTSNLVHLSCSRPFFC